MSLLSFSDEEMDLLTGLVLWTEDLTGWRAALGIGRISLRPWSAWPAAVANTLT
jgi:hypothetical protein